MSTPEKPRKLSRGDYPEGTVLCEHCIAKCCRYFALQIDTPKTTTDYDYLRWYLLHKQATLFTDEGTWYLQVMTECKHLLPDNRCGIYETRPQICRDYSMENCEFDDDWLYERFFETAEQMDEYLEVVAPKRGADSIRSARPPILPILS